MLQRYDASPPDAQEGRSLLLAELLGRGGAGVTVEVPFYCDYGSQVELADDVFVNFNCVFLW